MQKLCRSINSGKSSEFRDTMAKVVNLRQFRKRKARELRSDEAERRRKIHGIPKHLKKNAEENTNAELARLDGHKLDRDDP